MPHPTRYALTLLAAATLAGCAHHDPGMDRYHTYCAMLNPLIAKANREQVLRRFGMPSKKEQVASLEVWQYLKNYGETTAGAAKSTSDNSAAAGVSLTLGIYDDVTIIFDPDGKLQSWKADIR